MRGPAAQLSWVTAALGCGLAASSCQDLSRCSDLGGLFTRHAPLLPGSVAVLFALGLAAALAHASWVELRVMRNLRHQQRLPSPTQLRAAVARAGIDGVKCLDSAALVAFCAGVWTPTVYVSRELTTKLRPAELDAVLIHELEHVRRREPLRRLVQSSLVNAFFFVPALRWFVRRSAEASELRADRLAIRYRGRRALAGALLVMDPGQEVCGTAAFGAATQARVAQVLGEPPPRHRMPPGLLIGSAAGLAAAWLAVTCATDHLPTFLAALMR